MLSTRSRFKVLAEIAEAEQAEISLSSDSVEENNLAQIKVKRERRRCKIIKELFETEKTYIFHLDLINKHFDFPLKFNCIVPRNVHLRLFSNIEQILEVNKRLLEYMEQTTVGQAFRFLGPFLKLYSTYANDHDQALNTLQEWTQKSAPFSSFIHTQECLPELKGLKLNALLITPIQRVPRYKLLLEDLLNSTPDDHHDYEQLREAAHQVGEIATHINEHIRQHENFQKMLAIQNSFDSSAPKILAPGRQFLKEGQLRKVSRKGGKSHERMFFLFSDMLLYGKPKFLEGSRSYNCCCVLPLKHCQVEAFFGGLKNHDGGGMFRVSCKEETLVLYSHDQEEVQSWIDLLQSAIKTLCSNRQTLKKPSSKNMPLRGRTMLRNKLNQKKNNMKRRILLSSVDEDSTSVCKSPCHSLHISAVRSPLRVLSEVGQCLTPPKSSKVQEKETDNDSQTYDSNVFEENEFTENGLVFTDLRHIGESTDFDQSEDIDGSESQSDDIYGNESQSDDFYDIQSKNVNSSQSEDSIMQITMAGLDSFDLKHGSQQTIIPSGNDDCTKHKTTASQNNICAQRPLQGLFAQGRRMTRQCRKFLNRLGHSRPTGRSSSKY